MLELRTNIAFASCHFGLYLCLCLCLSLVCFYRLFLISYCLILKGLANHSYPSIYVILLINYPLRSYGPLRASVGLYGSLSTQNPGAKPRSTGRSIRSGKKMTQKSIEPTTFEASCYKQAWFSTWDANYLLHPK